MPSRLTSAKPEKKRISTSTKVNVADVSDGKRGLSSSVAALVQSPTPTQDSASSILSAASTSPPLTPSPSTPGTSEDSVVHTPPTATVGTPGLSSPTAASVGPRPLPLPPAHIETFNFDNQYTELETHLRQYSKDVYTYTLALYHAQRIDAAHRGRAAALALNLKRAVSDIAIPMKAMAVGDGRGARV